MKRMGMISAAEGIMSSRSDIDQDEESIKTEK